jgi:hypothetical protein
MGLDSKRFRSAKFTDRTEQIEVLELKAFFPKDEKPIWTIRAISGEQMYFVRAAVDRSRNTEEILAQLVSGSSAEKAKAALKALGLDENDPPDDYIRRLHILRYGSKDPDLMADVEGLEVCKKIAENHGVLFDKLTTRIMALTGLGRLGEPKPSIATKKSKVA